LQAIRKKSNPSAILVDILDKELPRLQIVEENAAGQTKAG